MKLPRLSAFFYFVLLVCFFIPATGLAQVGGPGCDPFDPLCPIDGGLSFLIAAGIGLAAKEAYKNGKKAPAVKD